MNMSRLSFVYSGVLSALAWGAVASDTFGQGCACGGNAAQGFVYESAAGQMSEADALLQEIDDPSQIFNLTVVVQDKAIVTVNGEPTFTTGSVRNYIVRGLKPGKSYKFVVEGLFKNPTGAEYAAKEEFTIKAGESKQVVLNLRRKNRTPPPPVLLVLPPPAVAPALAPAAK